MKSAIALIALGCVGLSGLAFASSAGAASSALPIIGVTSASGQIAVTTMSARKSKASALFIRGYGRGLSAFAVVACSRRGSVATKLKTYNGMQSGKLYSVPLPFAGDCEVTASLRGSGRIQLQIVG